MEKLLVMGGSYFIGKHVVNTLKNDYELYVLNRGSQPFNDPKVNEIVADRNDKEALKHQLTSLDFQHIIDISGFNQTQVQLLLETLNKKSLKSYVFISSGAVYDITDTTPPFKEDDKLGGSSPYGQYAQDKIAAENYLTQTLNASTLSIIRPPFVYGEDNYLPRERFIFHCIENDQTIYIPKSNNSIQFVYVQDLAKQIQGIIQGTIPKDIYNVGDNDGVTFETFVKACAEIVGKQAKIKFVDSGTLTIKPHHFFPFLPLDYVLDVKKIKQFSSHDTSMNSALKSAYKDYKNLQIPFKIPKRMHDALTILNNQQ